MLVNFADLFPVLSVLAIALYELNGSGTAGFIPTSISPLHIGDISNRVNKNDEIGKFRKHRTDLKYEKRNDEEYDESISNTLFEWDRRREKGNRKRPPTGDDDGLARRDIRDRNREIRNTSRKPKKIDRDKSINGASGSDRVDLEGTSAETEQQQERKEKQPMNANPFDEPRKTLTVDTLTGGPNLIFAMARRMLFWENNDDNYDEGYGYEYEYNDGSYPRRMKNANGKSRTRARTAHPKSRTLPRWHPYDGIADANPSFRMKSPAMNNRGYASTIRRNSRKRGKVSLWRHALRMYDKMKAEELEQQHLINIKERHPSSATVLRTTEHFEAASVACAKLGLWREAFGIYHEVVEIETNGKRKDVSVTENLILSLVGSCVRAARMRRKQKFSEEEQREPLDAVKEILKGLRQNHGLDLESRHVNPLAAAYQHLGLTVESSEVVESFLLNQGSVASSRHGDDDDDSVTIIDTGAKDKASYNIMVQSAIMDGNWTTAIDSLRNMTNAGLYPNSRNLNLWSETAKKRELRGGGRRMRSWKKKRERMLVRGTLPPTVSGKENSPPGP